MKIEEFKSGTWESGFRYKYFIPSNINHSFSWDDDVINSLLEKASLKLGELNSFSRFVPDIDTFIIMHIYKEAVISSRIEGTRTNIEEALDSEAPKSPEKRDDWLEVNNYVKAMNIVLEELQGLANGYDSIALVCYELPNEFCHRHLISQWLMLNGFEVEEYTDSG